MPLAIRYSPPDEVEISLDCATARNLADMIARGGGEMTADPAADPKPYDRLLRAVRIVATPSGKVVLSVDPEERVLRAAGAREHLAVLAGVVRDLAEHPDPDTHLHVEYFDGHYYLAESEVSLVLQTTM